MLIKNKTINKQKWLNLLEKSDYSSPFQTLKFHTFFNSIEGFSADVIAIEEDDEYKALVVVTIQKEKGIKGVFSKRGIIYGGPLLIETKAEYLNQFFSGIQNYYKKKLIYIETRNYFDYSIYKDRFLESNFKYTPWLNFHLDSSDFVAMKKTMSSSRLRQVKKAIKNGATWKEAESLEDVKSFYQILSNLYTSKIKKPLFDIAFFIKLYEDNLAKYLLVYHEGKVIGGIVCLILPDKAIYEFYVCGLDYENRNQYPSVMATWGAMEYATQHSIPLFDFMGAGSPDEAYGVREFKSRFGGQQVEHGRFINILNPFLYKLGLIGLNILSKMK